MYLFISSLGLDGVFIQTGLNLCVVHVNGVAENDRQEQESVLQL